MLYVNEAWRGAPIAAQTKEALRGVQTEIAMRVTEESRPETPPMTGGAAMGSGIAETTEREVGLGTGVSFSINVWMSSKWIFWALISITTEQIKLDKRGCHCDLLFY